MSTSRIDPKVSAPFIALENDTAGQPMYLRIYDAIRTSILEGKLAPRTRLPASRALAESLGVSRITVVNAFEQLLAEGYLEGRRGSGTFVTSDLPEDLLHVQQTRRIRGVPAELPARPIRISVNAERMIASRSAVSTNGMDVARPFRNGLTAVAEFPFEIWERLAVRALRRLRHSKLGYGETAGYLPLREAIASHLASSRGVNCSVDQVIVTGGAQQAIDLITRVLIDPGDEVLIEDPCYQEALALFRSAGARVVPIPVDSEGIDVAEIKRRAAEPRLIYVTPSHQYPLGVTMTAARRLSLLEAARETETWIVEDDYNSEFRYAGRPLASLQNLDSSGRVIYVGTFSKTIFPALRIGCLVVPRDLVDVFRVARNLTDTHNPILEQAILADFISEGHFGRHLRRMRALYQHRQEFLVAEANRELGEFLRVEKAPSGMHLVAWLTESVNVENLVAKALDDDIHLSPLRSYCVELERPPALVLGYTGYSEDDIRHAIRTMKRILEKC